MLKSKMMILKVSKVVQFVDDVQVVHVVQPLINVRQVINHDLEL